MVGYCVINCTNSTKKGYRLFSFPTAEDGESIWVQNVRRRNWKPGPGARVCEVHFEDSHWESHREDKWVKLKPNAVPTKIDCPNPPKRIDQSWKSVYRSVKTKENLPPNARIGHTYKYEKKVTVLQQVKNIPVNVTNSGLIQHFSPTLDQVEDVDVYVENEALKKQLETLKLENKKLKSENENARSILQNEIASMKCDISNYQERVRKMEEKEQETHNLLYSFLTVKIKAWLFSTKSYRRS